MKTFLREPDCARITGLSKSTRRNLEKLGKFPLRRKLSANTIGWLSDEIEEWMEERLKDCGVLPSRFSKNKANGTKE